VSRRLTWRQREVIVLLAEGLNAPDIAVRLHIAESTATAHIKAALQRLGAVNRAHAVALAVMSGELILPLPHRLPHTSTADSAAPRDRSGRGPFEAWQTTVTPDRDTSKDHS
jgi:DNA-binding CsgD family transcriptional regulator